MSNLLFAENPLVVNTKLARIIGLNEAIVLQQIHYWLEINKKTNHNFYEGKYWTYNTIKDWHETNFDFWSIGTVKRTFESLEKKKLLISANFNAKNFDRTKWYSIDYEVLASLEASGMRQSIGTNCTNGTVQNEPMEEPNLYQCIGTDCTNGTVQNAPMDQYNLYQAIPETTTETTTEISPEITAETTTTTTEANSVVVRGGVYKYCEKYLGLLSSTAIQEIGFFLDHGIQPEVIQLAVDASIDNNVRSWKYTGQILQKCLADQCLTTAQFLKRDMDFKNTQQRGKTNQQPSGGNPFLERARAMEALQQSEIRR